ncbi:MAG: hypothetical protein KGH75_01520 [Rhodospirillales bacterium]|nr:hypothetical protein [Rhodospirillales bacterium]
MATIRPRLSKVLSKTMNALPALSLQSYTAIPTSNSTVFRITASYASSTKELTIADAVTMCTASLGDQFSLVPGSVEVVARTNYKDVFSGIITANTISEPVTAADLKTKYKLVSANVFMDDEASIWQLVGDGESRRLVQAIKEDLSKILESRLARKGSEVVASYNTNFVGVTPERGDYALYYSVSAMDYDYGYAVVAGDSIYVAPRNRNVVEKVVSEQIIDCVEASSLPPDKQDHRVLSMMFNTPKVTNQNFSPDMASEYLNYMRQIYADTPYFTRLEELVSLRRNLANTNAPLMTMEA